MKKKLDLIVIACAMQWFVPTLCDEWVFPASKPANVIGFVLVLIIDVLQSNIKMAKYC